MGYQEAFAAVPGCEVIWCEYFGSYQGRLLAKIKYKGEILYLHDWFGSCSHCDAFEGEFTYDDPPEEQLAEFGKSYVESALPLENILASLEAECDEWDGDCKEMIDKLRMEQAL